MGFSTFACLVATLPTLALAQVDFSEAPNCPKGIQVITACGTGQSQTNGGYGTIQGLTQNVVASIEGSSSVALQYPANENPYSTSVDTGVSNLNNYIKYFVDGCPNIQLVLIGYSQGAQVSLTTMCGWPSDLFQFASVETLPEKYRNNILGIVAYGDPTHTAPTDFDKGNSTHNGIFPRLTQDCDTYSSKIASWCDNGDEFCDSCPPPLTQNSYNPRGCDKNVHESYWDIYNEDATQWVAQQYNAVNAANPSKPDATPKPTSSSTKSGSGSSQPTSTSSAAGRLQPPFMPLLNFLRGQRIL